MRYTYLTDEKCPEFLRDWMIRNDDPYEGEVKVGMRVHACYWKQFPLDASLSMKEKIAKAIEWRGERNFAFIIPISKLTKLLIIDDKWQLSWFIPWLKTSYKDPCDEMMFSLLKTYCEETNQMVLESGQLIT